MSWKELQKVIDDKDLDGLLAWVDANPRLIDHQILTESVQGIFGNHPVQIEPGDREPRYDDYVGKITVGEDWTCSPEFYDLLTSREWEYDISIRDETIEEDFPRTYTRWAQDTSYKVFSAQLVYRLDSEHGAKASVELSLYKDSTWIMKLTLPQEIPFPKEMSHKEVRTQAKALMDVNLDAIFEEAKARYESGDFEKDE